MENAGRPADQMAGTRTGVFVGIGGTDYSKIAVPYDDYYQRIDAHMGTGNALSIAANRLSYIFDFHGPSAAVDTACSSSSLAIHFAVESLRRGESDAALAGGVNMILTPETTIAFSKARMLSPEGKCRPFDAGANGYVRGEGCGLVLLKRLADAERDGDNILAVLRATSVNQDGRTSGISAPNSQSQIACIRAALEAGRAHAGRRRLHRSARHGHAAGRSDRDAGARRDLSHGSDAAAPPCHVSSVKANVGHMETVSGVAGLIKVVLMMEHEAIAPQTHFESLNPHIQLAGTRLVIPTEHTPWPRGARPRIAGVSSFGFGGTNTHLIVESPPTASAVSARGELDRPLHVLKLSAKTETALARQAEATRGVPRRPSGRERRRPVLFRQHRPRRFQSPRRPGRRRHEATCKNNSLAWPRANCPPAASKALSARSPVPRSRSSSPARACNTRAWAADCTNRTLSSVRPSTPATKSSANFGTASRSSTILYPEDGAADDPQALIHQTEFTQPALFALEYALAELWQSWGVVPDIVLGHSVGEYAAACVAGVMSLEDGLALIAERARLMQSVKRHGKMAVVFAPPEKIAAALAKHGGQVVIAVLNGPENTVVSGEADAVEALAAELAAAGIQTKLLNVSHAFHSPLMDEMLDEFEEFAAGIEFQAPQVPLAANLTGRLMTEAPTPRYWRDHLRNTVRFAEGMARVAEAAPTAIVEIGPTASLLGMGRRCVPELETAWLPSLRQGQDDWQTLAASVAEYYVRGGQIDWRAWDEPWPRRRVRVPNYPFERSRHWITLDASHAAFVRRRRAGFSTRGIERQPVARRAPLHRLDQHALRGLAQRPHAGLSGRPPGARLAGDARGGLRRTSARRGGPGVRPRPARRGEPGDPASDVPARRHAPPRAILDRAGVGRRSDV